MGLTAAGRRKIDSMPNINELKTPTARLFFPPLEEFYTIRINGDRHFLTLRNRSKDPKITGEVEARIIALACGEAPKGASRWSIRLLAEKAVELDIIESIGRESIRVILKKANLDLGNKSAGVFPPKKIQPS